MASVSGIRSLSVEHLLEAVQRLSPDEREESAAVSRPPMGKSTSHIPTTKR